MKQYIAYLVLLLISGQASSSDNSRLILTLQDSVEIKSSNVLLKDIVKSVQGDIVIYEQLKNIKLGEFGRVNQYRKIHKDEIEYLLSKNTSQKIKLNSSASVIVRQIFVPHSISDVSVDIEDLLLKNLNGKYEKVQVTNLNKEKEIKIPVGNVSYKYSLNRIKPSKRFTIWLDIYINQKHYQTMPLWYELTAYGKTYITKRRIRKGELINAVDFMLVERDLTMYRNPYSSAEFSNSRASKTLLEGSVLLSDQVEKLPVVYKGQIVKVISEYGNVIINASGIAQQDGEMGDVVSVIRSNSSNKFNGIVLKPGLVKAMGS